jgi:hypothetical protein
VGIIESVQQYDLNIPAGGAQAIDVAGDRIQFLSAADPFAQIEVRPNYAQGNISLKPGQGFRFSEQVTRWVVFNRGQVPLTGFLMIGSGDFFDQRISGEVSIIDGERARTLANTAFICRHYQAPVAGNGVTVQMWNPAGSGRNIVLESFGASSVTSQAINCYSMTAALATLGAVGNSKLIGGAPSVAQGRGTNGNTPPTGNILVALNIQAGQVFEKSMRKPIILPPGNGIGFYSGIANADLAAFFEYFEEPA